MPSPALSVVDDRHLTFHRNDYMIKEGSDSDVAYLILSGRVEIRKGAFSSAPQRLAVLGKGEIIGEMALFDDNPRMASAIALEDTTVRVVSREEMKRRIDTLDPVMRGILRILVKRLRQMAENVMPKQSEVNWSEWKKN
jgi:CRP-like cAMP-binding protein